MHVKLLPYLHLPFASFRLKVIVKMTHARTSLVTCYLFHANKNVFIWTRQPVDVNT